MKNFKTEKKLTSVWKDGIGSRVGASVRVSMPLSAPGFAVALHRPLCFMLGSFITTCRDPGEPDSILSALWEQQHRGHKSHSWYSQVFFCAFSQ